MKHRAEEGFSVVEVMTIVTIVAALAMVAAPALQSMFSRTGADGAALQLAAATREARWNAVSKGWQYRLQGYGKLAAASSRNQYRLLARSSTAVAWPADTSAPFTSSTQYAGPWISLAQQWKGVDVNPTSAANGGRFLVSFDPRGAPFENEVFQPLTITSSAGKTRSLIVSTSGNVQIQ